MKKITFLLTLCILLIGSEFKDTEAKEYIILDKKCEEGNASSCLKLGAILYKVQKDDLDSFFVQNYYKKACDVGGLYSGSGCYQIAASYHIKAFNKNITKTARQYYVYMAKKFYKKACERNNETKCEMLEIIDENFKKE